MAHDQAAFAPTRWSLIARAAAPGLPGAREALEELCRAYWWPLYAYLRRIGLDGNDAADTVQGLFAELIEKGRFAHADPERGRFRSWLLSALKFHLSHERERESAAKRGGRVDVIPLDQAEAARRWTGISNQEQEPDRMFERAWALAVLEHALTMLERSYTRSGKSDVFTALKPNLVGDASEGDLQTLATRLGVSSGAVKTAVFRLRKAFGEAIRAELASTLDVGCDVEEELRAMFSALSSGKTANP